MQLNGNESRARINNVKIRRPGELRARARARSRTYRRDKSRARAEAEDALYFNPEMYTCSISRCAPRRATYPVTNSAREDL